MAKVFIIWMFGIVLNTPFRIIINSQQPNQIQVSDREANVRILLKTSIKANNVTTRITSFLLALTLMFLSDWRVEEDNKI